MRTERFLKDLLVAFVLCLLTGYAVKAAPFQGYDYLGLAMVTPQGTQDLVVEAPADFAIGFLDATFGDPYKNLKVLLDSGKFLAVRIHLADGTCWRAKHCPPGAPNWNSFATLQQRAQKFNRFMSAYPNVQLYVSPFLEHDATSPQLVQRWFQIIRQTVPKAKPVCSAFKGYCPRDVLIEKHDAVSQADITSPDGVSQFDINNFKYLSLASKISMGWANCMNGRFTGEETFVDPMKRKAFCTRQDIKQIVQLLKPASNFPTVPGCSRLTSPKDVGPELFKTNAEYYFDHDDGRGNKALAILAQRFSSLDVQTLGGTSVGTMRFYGTYNLGGYRYYIGGRYGSNYTPMQLKSVLGSEWGLITAGGRCWIINAVRRYPYYQKFGG